MEKDSLVYEVMIRERHLDLFGHVNNAKYLELYEEARWNFMNNMGHGVEYINRTKIGPVVLALNIKFRKELCNQEVIKIYSNFVGMKNSKVILLNQRMEREGREIVSTVDIELGVLDLRERKLLKPEKGWGWFELNPER